jgi:NAD(P)-dependent dehydrogenase (short-subunit alcohol dehydrogenase family)
LEFVHQLLQRPGQVIATCRAPDAASGLHDLQNRFGASRLQLVQLDTADEESIARAAAEVAAAHAHLDLLLNVSGVLHIPGVLSPETALSRVTAASLHQVFATNAFGPTLVCKHFAPLLLNASKASAASE